MPLPLVMKTEAFEDGGVVPPRYSCFGDNVQPEFEFQNVPENAASLALWNISPDEGGLPEGRLPPGAVVGRNVDNRNAYLGPGAPPGPRYHHYVFQLFALDRELDLPRTAGRVELLRAMDGHVIDKAAYVGRFRRERLN